MHISILVMFLASNIIHFVNLAILLFPMSYLGFFSTLSSPLPLNDKKWPSGVYRHIFDPNVTGYLESLSSNFNIISSSLLFTSKSETY